jgi:hypothetical protein
MLQLYDTFFLQRNIYICVKLLIPNGTKVVEFPLTYIRNKN